MRYMSDREYKSRLKSLQEFNKSEERKMMLKAEKNKHGFKFKMPSTSKIVLAVTFLMCLQIMIFCEYAMLTSGDFSALYVLIGAPVSLVPICISYYWKSKNENTQHGIKYDLAMLEKQNELGINQYDYEQNPDDNVC